MTLADILTNRDNNIKLLRLLFAIFVVYTHSYDLLGLHGSGIFNKTLKVSASQLGVDGFFVLSGFLIYVSFSKNQERNSLNRYVVSRFLRLFPALIVFVILMCFVVGPYISDLAYFDFITHPSIRTFLIYNSTLIGGIVYNLSGVFEANPSSAICGSLWTLPYELVLYFLLPIIILLSKRPATSIVMTMVAIHIMHDGFMENFQSMIQRGPFLASQFNGLSICFLVGALLATVKDNIQISHRYAIIALLFFVYAHQIQLDIPLVKIVTTIAFAYLVFYLSSYPKGLIRKFNEYVGDYSYGIYIWSFPIQQLLIHNYPQISPVYLFFVSLFFSICMGALSWHLVEKKCLQFL